MASQVPPHSISPSQAMRDESLHLAHDEIGAFAMLSSLFVPHSLQQ
jgi:hypothetical protein